MLSISKEKLFSPPSYNRHTSNLYSANYTYCLPPFRNISSGTEVELELNLTEKSNITSYFLCGKAKDSRMSFWCHFSSLHHSKRAKYNWALLMSLLCFPRAKSVGNTFSFSINNPLSPTKSHSKKLPRPFFKNAAKKLLPLK